MSFKVWRRKVDNSVVGFCDAEYVGFAPGGSLADYQVSIEATAPVIPPGPHPKQDVMDRIAGAPTLAALKTELVDAIRNNRV